MSVILTFVRLRDSDVLQTWIYCCIIVDIIEELSSFLEMSFHDWKKKTAQIHVMIHVNDDSIWT